MTRDSTGKGRLDHLVARTRRDTPKPPATVSTVVPVEAFGRRRMPVRKVEILSQEDRFLAIMAPRTEPSTVHRMISGEEAVPGAADDEAQSQEDDTLRQ